MKRYSLLIGVLIALIFNTGLNAQTYCTTGTSTPFYMGISGVQLNTISYFNSSNAGYVNNTALSTTLIPGSSYSISVYNSGIYPSFTYNQWFSVWIDYNKDGIFNNTNERVVASTIMSSVGSASFTVPTTGFTGGSTRLRVKTEYSGYTLSDACQNLNYGETEDYTVVLPSGGALHFDGVNDQVNCGNGSSVQNLAPGGLTMEARVSVTNASIINSIIRKTGDYNLYIYGNKLYAEIWDVGNGNPSWKHITGTTTLSSNTSTHVACVWNGSNATLYVNGAVDPSTMSSGSIGGSENLYLGESSIYYNQPFGGIMDEVRIWGRALCQGEIQNNMSCELSGTQTSLKAYYKFNQGIINQNNSTVTSLTDASGNGNNGTFISFAMTGASSNFVAGLISGTCSAFSGPTASISAGGSTSFCTGGSVTLNANTGTGLSYQWQNNGTDIGGANGASYTATTSGSYRVVVTKSGCMITSSPVAVTVNPLPAFTSTVNQQSCMGSADGQITLTATSGSAPYEYSKDAGTTYGSTNVFSGLEAGSYGMRIKDANGCQSATAVQSIGLNAVVNGDFEAGNTGFTSSYGLRTSGIINESQYEVTASPVHPCFQGPDHTQTGSGNAFYANGSGTPNTTVWTQTVTNITPNTVYYFSAWVNIQCDVPAAILQFSINGTTIGTPFSPTTPLFSWQQFFTSWNSGSNTSATIRIVNQSTSLGGNDFGIDDIFFTTVAPLQIASITKTAPTCSTTSNGSVTITAQGGTAPYQFSLSNGTSFSSGSNPYTFTGVTPGSYTVKVKDNCGFESNMQTVVVTHLDLIPPAAIAQNATVTLDAAGNGSITAAAINNGSTDECGVASVTVTPNSFNCSNVGSNTVTLTVTDINGNASTAVATVTVTDVTAPTAVAQNITANAASGSCNANVTVTAPTVTDNCMNPTGSALDFDGANDHVAVATGLPSMSDMTIETWINPRNISNWDVIMNYNSFSTGDVHFQFYPNGTLEFSVAGNNPTDQFTTASFSNNQWYHFAAVYSSSGKYVKFYLNGTLVDTRTYVSAIQTSANVPFTIGGWQGQRFFDGKLDDLRIWNTARTQAQIQASMNTTLAGTESGLAAYYNFNGGTACANNTSAIALTDLAGGNNNGTLQNFALDGSQGCVSNWTGGAPTTGISLTNNFNNTSNASGTYPIGTTTVTWTVSDASGNASTCTQTVTVTDTQRPVISCAANVTANTTSGSCNASVTVSSPTATDNCNGASGRVTLINNFNNTSDASGTYPLGATTVRWIATDLSGNADTCYQTITVLDAQAPSITCPANITANVSGPALLANYPLLTGLTDATGNFGAVILSGNPTAPAAPTSGNPLCQNGIYRIDVNGQDVQTPNISTLNTSNFEIQVDFRLSGYNTSSMPVLTGGNGWRWIGIHVNSAGMAGITWNNSNYAYSTTQLNLNQWYSARLSFSANTAQLYIDGNLVQTTSTGALITGNNLNFTTNHFGNGKALNGCIRNLGIYNGTTTCSAPITIASPVTSDNCTAPNNSLMFDGADDRVIGTNSVLPLGASARTIEAWVFPKSNAIQTIYNYGNFAFNQRSGLLLLGGHLYYVGQNNDFNATSAIVPVNQWSHVAVTLSGTSVSFYVNGTLVQFGNLGATPATAGNSWTIGTASGTLFEPMNGAVDEVRVWNTVRTQPEISANMNTSFSGTLPVNLVANYNFNQGVANGSNTSVTTLNDQTGNGNGTLTSFNGLNNGTTSNWSTGVPAVGNGITVTNNYNNTANASGIYPVGATTVVWTATDPAGNTSTCSQTVTVIDNILPTARTQNITIQLNASGSASITASQINSGSGDNCGIASMTVSPSSFTCLNVGPNVVTLTVTDVNGNVATGTATVTVQDVTLPVALAKNITVQLDANGAASITATDVNDGSNDVCGIQSMTVSPASFNCSNIGANIVTLTVTDNNGNVSTTTATVTIEDNIAPVALAKNITVQLDANGAASIVAVDVNNGSTDACGIQNMTVSPASFNCSNVGPNTVTLTVTDNNGNASTATSTVTVEDNVAPVALAKNITVQLDASGAASIVADDVNDGSTDACAIAGMSVSPNTFSCSTIGANTVTLTVTDNNGNVSTATATVAVEDYVAPVALAKNITVQLDASGAASIVADDVNDGSTDACGIQSTAVSPASFNCSNVGANTVTLTVTDNNGNTSTVTAVVTIEDHVAPVVLTKNITVQLNASGSVSIVADDVNDGSTDACGIQSTTVSPASFNCSNVGANTVTLTVTDNNGNTSTATAIVTVEDHVAPVTLAKNITVQLNASGAASIVADDVNNGSGDACGIASMSVSPNTFSCSNVGTNTVTLTVTDNNGNTSTSTAVVTVEDHVAPVVLTKNITVQLNASGSASIITNDVNNGSSDACGIASMSASPNAFSCSNVGANTVTLTVTDNNGNTSTATALVTVQDHIAPVVLAKNITVQLNASGSASIIASDVNNGSSDACGIASMSVSPNTFSCSNVGANTVTLTVTDNNGNASTATAVVTIEDHVAPVVLTKNITVQLNASGSTSIVANNVNNGSSDACGIASMSVSPNTFSCSNVGVNTVTLTVTDINGNTSTGTATVTVEDKVAPVAICKNLTVTISGGSVSITAAQVNNGSNDACGIKSLSLNKTSFNCSEIGNNTVTLTVTDNNNNVSTCQATVTVNGVVPSCSITATPSTSTYTGAAANQMFIGYGPQSMNMQATATGAGPFTYNWSGPYLSSSTIANPVFTPTVGGSYTLTCSVTNSYGCVSTCSIVICVLDVRAPGGSPNNQKVYLCHVPPGNPSNPQTLQISASAVPAHLSHSGDKLGTCGQVCGLAKTGNESSGEIFSDVTTSGEINLIVYPNPSSSVFNFRLETESEMPVNIRVYDMSGRVVYELTGASAKEAITIGEQIGVGMFMAEVKQGEFYKVVKITKVN